MLITHPPLHPGSIAISCLTHPSPSLPHITLPSLPFTPPQIFRESVDKAKVNVLMTSVPRASAQMLEKILQGQDIHTVAALLKASLKDLPETLMSFRLFPDFMEAYQANRYGEQADLADALNAVSQSLSADDMDTLQCLLAMLRAVKTVAPNMLAYTFGPLLLRNPQSSDDMMKMMEETKACNEIVVALIHGGGDGGSGGAGGGGGGEGGGGGGGGGGGVAFTPPPRPTPSPHARQGSQAPPPPQRREAPPPPSRRDQGAAAPGGGRGVEQIEGEIAAVEQEMAAAQTRMEFERCIVLKGQIDALIQERDALGGGDGANTAGQIEAEIDALNKELSDAQSSMQFEKCIGLRNRIEDLQRRKAAMSGVSGGANAPPQPPARRPTLGQSGRKQSLTDMLAEEMDQADAQAVKVPPAVPTRSAPPALPQRQETATAPARKQVPAVPSRPAPPPVYVHDANRARHTFV